MRPPNEDMKLTRRAATKTESPLKRYQCTVLLLGSVLLMFGVELAVGAIGSDERLLALGAIPDSGTIG